PPILLQEMSSSTSSVNGYPPSKGTPEYLLSVSKWLNRTCGVDIETSDISACVGTKEFVASLPHYLKLVNPAKNVVAGPKLAYPTYEMGAKLAGCDYVGLAETDFGIDLDYLDGIDSLLCLWINSPANPTGHLEDLERVAKWANLRGVPVISDECYMEYNWLRAPETILKYSKTNILALHSLSKRSNAAGIRVGSYCGDPELVYYLTEIRKHAGAMVAGPLLHAASAALYDDDHVKLQRERYLERLSIFSEALTNIGLKVSLPDGGFYLWAEINEMPPGDKSAEPLSWAWTRWLANNFGVIVAPGDLYGQTGESFLRIALVQPTQEIAIVAEKISKFVV
ncbi:MAG: aminotransferase class I/II-fold pyridoxal phosphate-dependent enzyme, partial [Acidimicrobiales bacterium]|nr:aminotransferase class I/II-fold pyridoxal phosphate-dependent enzyme [Acidimicrobiales bacterium]